MSNIQECVQQIQSAVQQLRSLVHGCSTSDVVGGCFAFHLRKGNNPEFDTSLSSPVKQCSFLLGLLLESPEPDAPKSFSEEDWRKAEQLLEQAFLAYLPFYFPTQEERSSLTKEWYRVRRIAMPSFLHFFNTGLLASAEQVAARIRRYLAPFDEYLSRTLGISATQAVEICEWMSSRLQNGLDSVSVVLEEERAARLALLDEAQAKNWSLEDLQSAATTAGYQGKIDQLKAVLPQLGKLQYADLVAAFPHAGAQFWQLFSIGREEGPILSYPTERSIADERPLIRLSDMEAMCPFMNAVFNAILLVGEQTLSTGERRDAYFRARDKALECEAAEHFQCMLGSQAELHSRVFETPDLHHEHDLVLIHQELCLIVEVKASPPVEPFRDPERAFVRLRHAFRAETGIQNAYEQAMHLFRRLEKGESITLYDQTGNRVAELSPERVNRTFCVCLTRDDYGPLATDLALLLEKEEREPYPRAINVLDLGALGDAWSYFGWGAQELREYLEQRIQLHGKVFADDELDFVGYYIQHGSFAHAIEVRADLIQLDPTYSGVFGDIYRHLHHAGPPVKLQQTPPVMADLRKSLMTGTQVFVNISRRAKVSKVGRNKPCPCGSGRKYKKCCGR